MDLYLQLSIAADEVFVQSKMHGFRTCFLPAC